MNFASDNWAGVSERVASALADESRMGPAPAYGNDPSTRRAEALISEIFERDLRVFFVATGTAANVLSLESMMRPGGVIFCHDEAHVRTDEGGAAENAFGARLHAIVGPGAKISAADFETAVRRFLPSDVHHGRPVAVSLTQATELGTVYQPAEIAAISAVARSHGMGVHMDGARFANAVVSTDASPAELTWKAGVDILSLGGTKNGCWCAEAVVLFDPARAEEFAYAHKRSAQLFSKSRFVAAQFLGLLGDGHWLENARSANGMTRALADGIKAGGRGRLHVEPEANELFVYLDTADADRLKQAGGRFHRWAATDKAGEPDLYRFVTSFATTAGDVEELLTVLNSL